MFSVIVPVHNSETTIEVTLLNILRKLPFFEDEIIIVNDGSTDDTANILNKFKDYSNVKVINQSNQGVSSARNNALEVLSENTQFVTFVDDSDYLGDKFFEYVLNYFKKNSEIDIAVTPITTVVNGKTKNNNLNYKFNSQTEVVDIIKNTQSIHYHIGGVVFRKKIFTHEKYRFDETISYWEDAKLINSIFLEKQFYGLIKKATYFYNRNDKFSLSNTAWNSSNRYTYQIKANYFQLIRHSIGKYDKPIEYIQFLLANHFLEYIREHNQSKINFDFVLNDLEFISSARKMFEYISLSVIDKLNVPNSHKSYLYNLKNEPFPYYSYFDKISLFIQNYDFTKSELQFSFSPDSFGIPNESDVYIYSNRKRFVKATLYKKRFFIILEKQFNDFSRNIYKAKVSWLQVIFGCDILIVDKTLNEIIQIKNPSLLLRILKKLKVGKKMPKY
ncbi:glycosyltransferase family 2 protein [Staphylococcus gallinarum]|uniref:glycosyltransferase family A protein n=1 Tax=Staphylococcus gallinarum TaxID=1293 RepID=UPI0030C25532